MELIKCGFWVGMSIDELKNRQGLLFLMKTGGVRIGSHPQLSFKPYYVSQVGLNFWRPVNGEILFCLKSTWYTRKTRVFGVS